ncbi:hypothetical protein B0H11DRAFT_2277194 [Mycena galericulata]|nr:hypothetical protein B0H11DRAFT_2277194 [Mycena galericulata]
MLMHNGFYAWLQGKNNKKLVHSKAVTKENSMCASITLKKSTEYFFCFSTFTCGQRTLSPQTCVGELFLPTANGEVRLAGTAFMDQQRTSTQLGQVKNTSKGNGPANWFEAVFPSKETDFVRLRIRRAHIIKCDGGKELIDYVDPPESPFVVFQFNFIGKERGPSHSMARGVALKKETTMHDVEEDSKAGDKRKRGESTGSDVKSQAEGGDDSISDLSSIPESSRSPSLEIDAPRPYIKRLRSGAGPTNIASSSSSGGKLEKRTRTGEIDVGDEFMAELAKGKQLQKQLQDKLLATKKKNQKMQEMLDQAV